MTRIETAIFDGNFREWLIERLNFQSPRQARQRFLAPKQAA